VELAQGSGQATPGDATAEPVYSQVKAILALLQRIAQSARIAELLWKQQ